MDSKISKVNVRLRVLKKGLKEFDDCLDHVLSYVSYDARRCLENARDYLIAEIEKTKSNINN